MATSTAASSAAGPSTISCTSPIRCARTASNRRPAGNRARACVSPIRAITYGAIVAGQDPEPRLGEPEARAGLGDDEVGDRAQPDPASEREPVHAGDDRRRTGVDRLEHLGHGHRVVLVRLAVEVERRAHPRHVGAGAERRPVAGKDDRPQSFGRLAGERRERGPQLGDRGRVERVVDVGPGQRHARDHAAGAATLHANAIAHRLIVRATAGRDVYASAMLLGHRPHRHRLRPTRRTPSKHSPQTVGLAPGGGGRHPRSGTFNRLVWLGDTYLELMGVSDPELWREPAASAP